MLGMLTAAEHYEVRSVPLPLYYDENIFDRWIHFSQTQVTWWVSWQKSVGDVAPLCVFLSMCQCDPAIEYEVLDHVWKYVSVWVSCTKYISVFKSATELLHSYVYECVLPCASVLVSVSARKPAFLPSHHWPLCPLCFQTCLIAAIYRNTNDEQWWRTDPSCKINVLLFHSHCSSLVLVVVR